MDNLYLQNIPDVIVIANEPVAAIEIKSILSELDLNIIEIDNFRENYRLKFTRRVALVIAKMPLEDIREINHLLKAGSTTENVPLICLTQSDTPEAEILQLYQIGAVDVLQDPMHRTVLLRKAQVFLELHNKRARTESLVSKLGSMFKAQRKLEQERESMIAKLQDEIEGHNATKEVRERLEKQLRHSQKLETVGTLAGGIAHDFNNILGAILGFSEMTLSSLEEEDEHFGAIEQVYGAALRGADLVKQILTFSRQGDYELTPTSVHTIVGECSKLLRSTLPAHVTIEENIDLSCGQVFAVPSLIHQVVMNLCTNAAHALDKQSGSIQIRLQHTHIDSTNVTLSPNLIPGEYILLEIEDNGPGMNEELLGRIFEPFFTTKEVDKGTGLGLSVVHGIVMDLKGEILVRSELDKGTCFSIYLPRIESQPEGELLSSENDILGNECVLVAEDDPSLRKMIEAMLRLMGYTVLSAKNGKEAHEIITAHPLLPKLLITDYAMPEMNGLDLIRAVKKINEDLPVIMMSGYNEAKPVAELEHSSTYHFLPKPFTMKRVGEAIRKVMDSHAESEPNGSPRNLQVKTASIDDYLKVMEVPDSG